MADLSSRLMNMIFPVLIFLFLAVVIYVIATNADKAIKGGIKMMEILLGV